MSQQPLQCPDVGSCPVIVPSLDGHLLIFHGEQYYKLPISAHGVAANDYLSIDDQLTFMGSRSFRLLGFHRDTGQILMDVREGNVSQLLVLWLC